MTQEDILIKNSKTVVNYSKLTKAIRLECKNLRDNTTEEERSYLKKGFEEGLFSTESAMYCIYGLLTGNCANFRANKLTEKTLKGIPYIKNNNIEIPLFVLNSYLTILEGYIYKLPNNSLVIRNIIEYIVKEKNQLILPTKEEYINLIK